jgi:hypothetical protein
MWNKTFGAKVLLYGSYVGAVFVVLGALAMLVGGSVLAAFLPIAGAGKGFFMGLIMAILDLAIGGFFVWVMYSAGKQYLESGTFDEWKPWVVLILSALGLISSLFHFTAGTVITLLVNGLFIFAAAAMLFAEEE